MVSGGGYPRVVADIVRGAFAASPYRNGPVDHPVLHHSMLRVGDGHSAVGGGLPRERPSVIAADRLDHRRLSRPAADPAAMRALRMAGVHGLHPLRQSLEARHADVGAEPYGMGALRADVLQGTDAEGRRS